MTTEEQFALEVWQKNHPDPSDHKPWVWATCPFWHTFWMFVYGLLGTAEKREKEERRFWEERHEHGSGRDCEGACDLSLIHI